MGTTSESTVDLAVLGGGIIGLSVAWRARLAGMSVLLLERDELGSGATHVAAGMLAPVAEVEFGEAGRRVLELGMRSAGMWPDFAAELEQASGIDVGLRRTGTLVVARDDDEAHELERQLAFRESLGLRALRLRASEAREREPALAPTVRLALEAPDDHSVDPRRVVAALRRACELEGVQVREHTHVHGLELAPDAKRVVGVRVSRRETDDVGARGSANGDVLEEKGSCGSIYARDVEGIGSAGGDVLEDGACESTYARDGVLTRDARLTAQDGACESIYARDGVLTRDARLTAQDGACETVYARDVVVAMGAWSGRLAGLPEGAGVPVRPVKGQIMRLRDPAGPGLLQRVVRFEGGYLVPRGDGRYVLGATMEERGFEPQATAGGVYELLRDAHELVPGISELRIEELGVGYRPGTPDNAPVIGPGTLEGLTWATGHHRNGILLAPLTAELVTRSLPGNATRNEPISSS